MNDQFGVIPRRDQALFSNPIQLLVTENEKVIRRVPCQRIDPPYPDAPANHQVSTNIGRSRSGDLFVAVATHQARKLFRSTDGGSSWTDWNKEQNG